MISAGEAGRWRERDLAVLWHPCTQMREHLSATVAGDAGPTLPLVPIERGEGAWLVGRDGRRYLDAVSSWWTNLFGHAEPRIGAAIAAQARSLEQVILAGFSHAPAVELAERLLAIAPREHSDEGGGRAPLAKVFYADNGSAGVEVALKMAFHWFRNRGDLRRTKFVALANGYHGETLGALAVGDVPLYRRVYAPLLAECLFAPSPDAYDAAPGESPEDCARRAAAALGELLEGHAGEVCAFILEPLVQCAGGMRMHHPLYLRLARDLCDRHGVMLIADEIAVGPARAGGTPGIQPDLLCLSKGLTGGFLPLAAVLATQSIYDGFLDDSRERAFLHSHSYTGNPLACAAALASLSILDEDRVVERNRATASRMAALAAPLAALPHVADVRQAGMIVAFELAREGRRGASSGSRPFDQSLRVGLRAYRAALERGVVLRPLGDIVYWMPPYCIDDAQLELLARTTAEAIAEATACV